jgi:hypothetical protein
MIKKLKNIDWVRAMFLVPILLVMIVSISHVVTWYDLTNPFNWAIFVSVSVEIGAMASLIAVTKRIKGGVFFMFGLVTFIQMIGNIFYSFKEIDSNGDLFKSWVELTSPVWEALGTEPGDDTSMKRWLAFLEGGLLPIISLTSLHFFVKYDEVKPKVEGVNEGVNDTVNEGVNDTVNEVENKVEEIPTTEDEIIDDKRIDNLVDIQEEKIETTEIINEQLSEIIEEIGVDEIKDEEEVINNDNLLWSETNNIVEEDKDDKPTNKRLSYTKRG